MANKPGRVGQHSVQSAGYADCTECDENADTESRQDITESTQGKNTKPQRRSTVCNIKFKKEPQSISTGTLIKKPHRT